MSLQLLTSNRGDNRNGFPDITFLIPPAPGQLSLSSTNCIGERNNGPEMGYYQILNAPVLDDQHKKPLSFQPVEEGRETRWTDDGNDRGFVVQRKGLSLDQGEDEESEKKFGHIKLCARGHWRPHEDDKLKELVSQYGPQNWNLIAEKLEGRSGKSCRLRWFNQLDPRIDKRAFSEEEEERLLAAHRMYGNKWAMISRLFPGRTDNAVKNHWHVIMARRHREQNSVYRRRKPTSSQALPRGFAVTNQPNNACSESTVSSNNNNNNIDESASTCTDLYISPSSIRLPPVYVSRFRPVHLSYGPQMGLDQIYIDGNVICPDGPRTMAMDVGQSGNSESNSEVSAAESVGNNRTNLYRYGEKNMPFIDFLGVGAA